MLDSTRHIHAMVVDRQNLDHTLALAEADGMQDIYGPRFHCDDCPDFDYCFMCMSLESKSYVGKQSKQFDS